jgi:hypothetical protein
VVTAPDAQRVILAPIVAAAVAATYALVQVAGTRSDPLRAHVGLAGLVRPFATLGHPNFLSAFLAGRRSRSRSMRSCARCRREQRGRRRR